MNEIKAYKNISCGQFLKKFKEISKKIHVLVHILWHSHAQLRSNKFPFRCLSRYTRTVFFRLLSFSIWVLNRRVWLALNRNRITIRCLFPWQRCTQNTVPLYWQVHETFYVLLFGFILHAATDFVQIAPHTPLYRAQFYNFLAKLCIPNMCKWKTTSIHLSISTFFLANGNLLQKFEEKSNFEKTSL